MARARPGLEKAVQEALIRHGAGGKRLSLRQAERLTGLSPATIGELAKGNARTSETVRRFAQGLGEDVTRFLLLAGFLPEDTADTASSGLPPTHSSAFSTSSAASASSAVAAYPAKSSRVRGRDGATVETAEELTVEAEVREWLERFGRALAKMPPGRDRDLFKESLRRDTELIERFLEHLADADHRGSKVALVCPKAS